MKNKEYFNLIAENDLFQDIEEEYLKIIFNIEQIEEIKKCVEKEIDLIEKKKILNNIKIEILKQKNKIE